MTLRRETSQLSAASRRRGIEAVPPPTVCQESSAAFARCETERSLAGPVQGSNQAECSGMIAASGGDAGTGTHFSTAARNILRLDIGI